MVSLIVAYRSFGRSWQARHPPRYAAFLTHPSPSFGHSSIVDDGRLQGDGVNIAARIHHAAEPGQIVVTAPVRDYVLGRLPVAFHDLGTPPLKNITRPVRVYAVERSGAPAGKAALQPYLQWSSRPTVAVLPFRNVGGAEADSYFGEGVTEDIITGLSHSRAFYVIARASTLRYRDRAKDLRQIAGELGVRYILDGSVRRRGTRLRITAELVDVAANRPVWAERYDGADEDLFEFQDRIAARDRPEVGGVSWPARQRPPWRSWRHHCVGSRPTSPGWPA